jgi:hypothetical protein
MAQRRATVKETYRFTITPQDASLNETRIQKLLKKATVEAIQQAEKDGHRVEAKAGLEGGFGGVGEIAALLVLAAKSATGVKIIAAAGKGGAVLGKAILGGVGGAGGRFFFDKYLAPRLVKLNLLPSRFRPTRAQPSAPVRKKKPREHKRS